MYSTLQEWIDRESTVFSLNVPDEFAAAVDRVVSGLGDSLEILGIGEPMHGETEFLTLRNRLFERLVTAHGFSAIAVESSFPRGRLINDYVLGQSSATFDELRETGFSHGFGSLAANRELIEWMRQYNIGRDDGSKLHFYGFDSPTEMMYSDSPRYVLSFVLDYLEKFAAEGAADRRDRIEALLGDDAAWETTEAAFNPEKSIGLSPQASALRLEADELICELTIRRPELVAKSSPAQFAEAMQFASVARQFLTYHAAIARTSADRIAVCLGIRDAMMADILRFISVQERERGRVLAFAHNSHLKRGMAEWELGPQSLKWWPAGAHLRQTLGDGYAVIGTGAGSSVSQGIGEPEIGTLEALLKSGKGVARFIPTHGGEQLPVEAISALPTRRGSAINPGYFPFTSQSLTDFDWLAVLDELA